MSLSQENATTKKVTNKPNAAPLTPNHKRAAHLLVMGATVYMVAKELNMHASRVENWTWQKQFLDYMAKIEKRFWERLESQAVLLRRAAFRVLQEKLSSDDPFEQRWAVDKILHATEDKTLNLNVNTRVDERPALSADAKEGAKKYLQEVKLNHDQYFVTKLGETD